MGKIQLWLIETAREKTFALDNAHANMMVWGLGLWCLRI